MATVAAERDITSRLTPSVYDGSAAEQRATPEAGRSWLERLLMRFIMWDNEHPHNVLHRTQHKLVTTGFRLGYGRYDDDMVLTTIGRTSGQPRHVIVGAIFIDDRLYVVNPFGDRAHWYRNLLADPIVTLQRRGKTWTARAARATDRDEAVMLYEQTPGATGTMLRWMLRAQGLGETAEDFADNIDRFCFVRFDEVHEAGPPPMKADLVWVWPVVVAIGLTGLLARRSRRLAVAGAAVTSAALLVLRGRVLVDRLTELAISRPTGPIGRMLYRDATSMHGEGWRICHERLALVREDHLLDVGCGGGTFLSQALETVDRAAGVDHSPDMVALTRESNARAVAEGRLDVRLGDAAALPWDDATFDAQSNLAALFFATDPPAVLREAARVLKPGGRLLVVTMPKLKRRDVGTRVMGWFLHKARLYSDEELAQLLRDAGFDAVEVYSPSDDSQVGYGARG